MANGIELVLSSHNPLVRRCESKRAQSCKSMRYEVTRYSVNHRIDHDAVEFDAVGVNAVIYRAKGFGDPSARNVARMTKDFERL